MPMINRAKREGFARCILPVLSAMEGGEIEGIEIYGATNLEEVIKTLLLPDFAKTKKIKAPNKTGGIECSYEYDFAQVKGQSVAKMGLEIAAAGGHNVIMVGSAGCGKTLMAKCLPSILPQMTKEEAIHTSEIYSVANLLSGGLIKQRPFRAPHHTITIPALVGGGGRGIPGEISLAHNGVLFLDEFAEFNKKAIEVLRQPLENGTIEISRVKNKYIYPARFMFVAAMNPCPCGHLYDNGVECSCTSSQISRYQNKVSGPILDRIDIFLKLRQIKASEIISHNKHPNNGGVSNGQTSEEMALKVLKAREIQNHRYKKEDFCINAAISQRKLTVYCKLGIKEEEFLKRMIDTLNISARGYSRILKIARTIADLKGVQDIHIEHLSSAIQLRYPEQ